MSWVGVNSILRNAHQGDKTMFLKPQESYYCQSEGYSYCTYSGRGGLRLGQGYAGWFRCGWQGSISWPEWCLPSHNLLSHACDFYVLCVSVFLYNENGLKLIKHLEKLFLLLCYFSSSWSNFFTSMSTTLALLRLPWLCPPKCFFFLVCYVGWSMYISHDYSPGHDALSAPLTPSERVVTWDSSYIGHYAVFRGSLLLYPSW